MARGGAVWLGVLCLLSAPGQAQESELNPEWLAKDVAIAQTLAKLLPPAADGLETLKAELGTPERERDLGCGAKHLRLPVYGGHLTAWVDVLTHRDRVARVRVRYRHRDPAVISAVRLPLAEAWGRALRRKGAGLLAEFRLDAPLAALAAERVEALGKAPEPVPASPEEAADLRLLCDPFGGLVVGELYGYAAVPPPGRRESERLAAAGRLDLLRVALRGPSPEGRVYAARALLAAEGELVGADRRAIAWVRASPIPIEACLGCEVFSQPARELLAP